MKELFMVRNMQLAIAKSLILKNDYKASVKVVKLLKLRFQQSNRFHKFITFILEDVLGTTIKTQNHHEFLRVKELRKRLFSKIFPEAAHKFRCMRGNSTKLSAYMIPEARTMMKHACSSHSTDVTRTRMQIRLSK